MIRLISLDYQPDDGPRQTLYIEADRAKCKALQFAQGKEDVVVPVYGRLTPDGRTCAWVLRGSRIVQLEDSALGSSSTTSTTGESAESAGSARVVREMSVGVTSLAEREVNLPDGRVRTGRAFVRRPPFVGVLPLRPGAAPDGPPEVLLVDQYRDAVDEVVREIPAGKIEPHELDEDPRQVAARELAEEAGLVAREWRPLVAGVLPSPGVSDEIARGLWVAWDLTEVPRRAEDAHIHSGWYPLPDAVAQIGSVVRDAKTVIALLLAERSWQRWPIV